jgi:hypothetical protein
VEKAKVQFQFSVFHTTTREFSIFLLFLYLTLGYHHNPPHWEEEERRKGGSRIRTQRDITGKEGKWKRAVPI